MAAIQDVTTGTTAKIEVGGVQRSVIHPIGDRYSISGLTGTIGAALGANSCIFAMRLDPATTRVAKISRIRVGYTTIVAYTVPITAGRRLALFRGGTAALTGGTAYTGMSKKDTASPASQFDTAEGGDARFATTAALTLGATTFDTNPIRSMTLSHVGAAGAFYDDTWEFDGAHAAPIVLRPGELIGFRNPVAMDAAGTWQLMVSVDWTELLELA